MSDISLHFTWWQLALGLLAVGFWPLTATAALAAFWVWRQRASRLAQVAALVAIGLWAASGATNLLAIVARLHEGAQFSASLRARQRTLPRSTVVAGMLLPGGTVLTRSSDEGSDEIVAIDLPASVEIRGVPVIGHVPLNGGALDGDVTLARDSRVGDARCSAREGARFESGRLVECRLSAPSRIRGIPCSGDVDLQVGVVCVLSRDYPRYGIVWGAQTKLTDFGDLVWFRTGTVAPSLRVFGAPLAANSEVEFEHGHLSSVDLRSDPPRFRGCTIELILMSGSSVTGQTAGACDLPTQPPGNAVLPSTTLSIRSAATP